MAQNVYLSLKIDGTEIEGESTVASMERENTIECFEYHDSVRQQLGGAGSTSLTGRPTYDPIKIVKRIDKSTPLLFKALTQNETIEGEFRFFRPDPAGAGGEQHFLTVKIEQARVSAIERVNPSSLDTSTQNMPCYEEVSFVFSSISVTYEEGGVEHRDSWGDNF